MRLALTALLTLSLSACTLTAPRPSSFRSAQVWQVTGMDGTRPVSAEVRTWLFGDYESQETDGVRWRDRPARRLNMSHPPAWFVRLLWPGNSSMILREPETGDTLIVWNAGQAGVLYGCEIRDVGPARTTLYGDLFRLDQGQDVPLGQCLVRQTR